LPDQRSTPLYEESVVKSVTKVQYSIQYSKRRKTIVLKISDEGTLKVYAPYRTSVSKIEQVIDSHSMWIDTKIAEVKKLPQQLSLHTYKDKDVFLFHTIPYSLRLIRSEKTQVYKEGTHLIVESPNMSQKIVKILIEQFYDSYGEALFDSYVRKWIKELGLDTVSYEIKMVNYPKRLGSCSSKNVLSFSRRALMLPLDLLDYLALHEVAHLVYFNHSREFKQLLATHMNDYKQRYERIKQLRLRISHI